MVNYEYMGQIQRDKFPKGISYYCFLYFSEMEHEKAFLVRYTD